MASSVYEGLLSATVAEIGSAGLTIQGIPVTALRSKLPLGREVLDALPVCVVCPGESGEESRPWTTADQQEVTYPVSVVLIAASNRDPVTSLDAVIEARQTIRRLLQRPTNIRDTVAELLRVSIRPGAPFLRTAFFQGYDYSALTVSFHCVEPAG